MGPRIILDKSAIQALSKIEIDFLFKHYYVVVTPILIFEILGDLKKGKKDQQLSKDDVIQLAKKLQPLDSAINANRKDLCIGSLLGYKVSMTGQAVVPGGIPLKTRAGEKGIFFEEAPERKLIRNWQNGIFSDAEEKFAKQWRERTRTLSLDFYKEEVRQVIKSLSKITCYEDLGPLVDNYISNTDNNAQYIFLNSFMNEMRLSQRLRNITYSRWLKERLPLFRDFSPYAYYCFRAKMIFEIGLARDLISTKSTNILDFEYIYYLPFCMVFSSGDNLHKKIYNLFLRNDQFFVDRDTLKEDLHWLSDEWNSLKDAEKEQRAYDYGSYPPVNPKSIAYKLWLKYRKPWKPGSGNLVFRQTKEEQEESLKQIRPFMEAIEEYRRKKNQ